MENINIKNLSPEIYNFLKKELPVICDKDDIKKVLKISDRTICRLFKQLRKKGLLKKEDNHPQIFREDLIELLDNLQDEKIKK